VTAVILVVTRTQHGGPSPDGPPCCVDAGDQRQVQRWSTGNDAMTAAECWPQPDQVTLPQDEQRAGLHI